MARFAQIEIGLGLPFNAEALGDDVREAMRAGIAAARQTMAQKVGAISQKTNGWTSSDIFGTRQWYGGNFLLRAVAAMARWGGNDVIEAMYPTAREDADGNPWMALIATRCGLIRCRRPKPSSRSPCMILPTMARLVIL